MKSELLLGEILKAKKLTMATAESFTGGLFGKRITDIPGSSEYFLGGIVAYSYRAKEKLLKVNKATLMKYGAVSAETAKEMATNIKNILNADIGVSFTGVAGPSLQEGKPVGLAHIGICYLNKILVLEEKFRGERLEIREKSVDFAIAQLINLIGGKI